ncbi:MAG: hypothetical protein CR982_09340 [Candidatus Cloacimonadota bacterium]|nr:MAG: hypothetical protein CR982_09340 [Candidatus Cloacimonadota bacterium]PIE77512.1 MAG: hypothetical protein CSA15_12630 [Candidatus Delongbacteria bacterium]
MNIKKVSIWIILIGGYLIFSYYSLLMDKFIAEDIVFDGKYKILWIFLIFAVVMIFMIFMTKLFDFIGNYKKKRKKRSNN